MHYKALNIFLIEFRLLYLAVKTPSHEIIVIFSCRFEQSKHHIIALANFTVATNDIQSCFIPGIIVDNILS